MTTIIDALRSIVGTPTFQNAEVFEYFFAGTLALIVVGSIFRLLSKGFDRV